MIQLSATEKGDLHGIYKKQRPSLSSDYVMMSFLGRLKHLNMEKNELYYVPMLKSVEGKVIPNDDEKEAKRLRRSAERSGRRSAKGSRSHRQETKKEDASNGETAVPKPTPVSQSTDTEKTEKDTETKSGQTNETSTGGMFYP